MGVGLTLTRLNSAVGIISVEAAAGGSSIGHGLSARVTGVGVGGARGKGGSTPSLLLAEKDEYFSKNLCFSNFF